MNTTIPTPLLVAIVTVFLVAVVGLGIWRVSRSGAQPPPAATPGAAPSGPPPPTSALSNAYQGSTPGQK